MSHASLDDICLEHTDEEKLMEMINQASGGFFAQGQDDNPAQYNLEKEAKQSTRAEYRRKIEALLDGESLELPRRKKQNDLDDLLSF